MSSEWDQEETSTEPQWERRRRNEKDEKDEKNEKDQRRDPLGALFGGLVLIMIGVGLFLWTQGWIVSWSMALGLFFLGLAAIFVIEMLIRLVVPAYRRDVGGRLISALVVALIGLGFLGFEFWGYDVWTFWPIIIIAIGVVVLLGAILGPWLRR